MSNFDTALQQTFRKFSFNEIVDQKAKLLLPSFLEDSSSARKKMEEILPQLIERISGQIEHIHHCGDMMYKEIFAHCHCYYLINGFMSLLDSVDCAPEALVMLDEEGIAAHYLVKATLGNKVCYIDAYGIHSNLEMITSRYTNSQITETVVFDHRDDGDPHYQAFIDKNCDLFDMAESVLASANEDFDMDNTVDFLEFTEESLALETFLFCLTHDITNEF